MAPFAFSMVLALEVRNGAKRIEDAISALRTAAHNGQVFGRDVLFSLPYSSCYYHYHCRVYNLSPAVNIFDAFGRYSNSSCL